jgi:hypothetical protein
MNRHSEAPGRTSTRSPGFDDFLFPATLDALFRAADAA